MAETGAEPGRDTDEALLSRVARGERAAFADLFDRYAGRIKAFLIRGGAAADVAEEAAQEVMVTLWRKADRFDPAKAGAATWIFTIARNKRIDLLRRDGKPKPDAEDPAIAADPPLGSDAIVSGAQRDARVRAAMKTLSREQLAVVELAFFAGLSHSEIAERLDTPLGTVKSRLRLSFGRLRDALGEAFQRELIET